MEIDCSSGKMYFKFFFYIFKSELYKNNIEIKNKN